MKKPHSQMTFSNKQFLYKEVWQVFFKQKHFRSVHFVSYHCRRHEIHKRLGQDFQGDEKKQSEITQCWYDYRWLYTDNNNDPLILKHLTKVTFTHLKQLDICNPYSKSFKHRTKSYHLSCFLLFLSRLSSKSG